MSKQHTKRQELFAVAQGIHLQAGRLAAAVWDGEDWQAEVKELEVQVEAFLVRAGEETRARELRRELDEAKQHVSALEIVVETQKEELEEMRQNWSPDG